jgi:hypothetical protein
MSKFLHLKHKQSITACIRLGQHLDTRMVNVTHSKWLIVYVSSDEIFEHLRKRFTININNMDRFVTILTRKKYSTLIIASSNVLMF